MTDFHGVWKSFWYFAKRTNYKHVLTRTTKLNIVKSEYILGTYSFRTSWEHNNNKTPLNTRNKRAKVKVHPENKRTDRVDAYAYGPSRADDNRLLLRYKGRFIVVLREWEISCVYSKVILWKRCLIQLTDLICKKFGFYFTFKIRPSHFGWIANHRIVIDIFSLNPLIKSSNFWIRKYRYRYILLISCWIKYIYDGERSI